jgi:hypothetical protein
MERCEVCPVPPGSVCLGNTDPRFAHFCGMAGSGDPVQVAHVVNRSAMGSGPSLVERAVNFVVATTDHVIAGMPETSPEEKARRLEICRGCDYFEPASARCLAAGCGCYLELKAGWADQGCPLEPPKWGPVPAASSR